MVQAIAIMPMSKRLVAHTLHEERDLSDYSGLFDHLPRTEPDRWPPVH